MDRKDAEGKRRLREHNSASRTQAKKVALEAIDGGRNL